jgi:hypothetical protein
MFSKALKNIILLISFFAVTCFSGTKICAAPAADQVKSETSYNHSQQFPNGELERVLHPSAAGWNITTQKNLIPFALSQGTIGYHEQVSFKSPVIKISSLRVKDYLVHIHPYHHFW